MKLLGISSSHNVEAPPIFIFQIDFWAFSYIAWNRLWLEAGDINWLTVFLGLCWFWYADPCAKCLMSKFYILTYLNIMSGSVFRTKRFIAIRNDKLGLLIEFLTLRIPQIQIGLIHTFTPRNSQYGAVKNDIWLPFWL